MKKLTFPTLLLLALTACQEAPPASFSGAMDTYFSEQFPENEPGAAVLVMKGEDILFSKGYGLADMETKEKITPNTLFNLGSISKTFVANGILILKDEGKLTLDDSLSMYFTDFRNPDIARKVRIVHLLSHTSGLPDIRPVDEDSIFFLTAKDEENFAPIKNNDSLHFEPGEHFEYSNPAYNGLALIIEKVAGEKWQDFIRNRILLPSDMPTSTITDGPHPEQGVSHGYVKKGGVYQEYDYGEYPTFAASGNGGVWSSVNELAHYELAMRNGAFLDKSTIAASQRPFAPDNWADTLPHQVGYSWFVELPAPPLNLKKVYHTGSQGGFRAFFLAIPAREILYVALFNQPVEVEEIMDKGLELMKEFGVLE
ncbi:MAG: beta-lactamase family protein [Phaeodactylibacter sp.]|nr:beta-lactamase family protein [Phaeodactylibacter sp.]MCB9275864.1 beta-lactamase family protein [Lewinellaceae bacterium]